MRLGLSIIYGFLKFFPTQENKVLFLSRQSDEITQDFSDTQELLRQKKAAGKLGLKSGEGFFDYSDGRGAKAVDERNRKLSALSKILFGA